MRAQSVATFPATRGDRGYSEGDAADVLSNWLQEDPRRRVVEMTGNEHLLIVVYVLEVADADRTV